MKKIIILLNIVTFCFIISCKDDTEIVKKTDEPSKKEVINNLKIDKNALNIIDGQTLKFDITEGNPPYKVASDRDEFLDISVKENVVTLIAKKGGNVMDSELLELTITDSKEKTQKISVNVYEKVDVQSISEEINQDTTKDIIFSSGYYDIIKVSSDNPKVATASKEIAQIGGGNIKLIQIQAIKEGECTISVTDGVETKKIKIKVLKIGAIVIKGPLPPTHTAQVLTDYNFSGVENTISVFGGTGDFDIKVIPKDAIEASIRDSGDGLEYYLKLKLGNATNSPIEITVSEKGNSSNTAKLNVKIIPDISFKYYKNNIEFTNVASDSGDDMIIGSIGDTFTVKVTGGYGVAYTIPNTGSEFKIESKSTTNNEFEITILSDLGSNGEYLEVKDSEDSKIKSYILFKTK